MCFTVQHSEMTITVPTIIETVKTKQTKANKNYVDKWATII